MQLPRAVMLVVVAIAGIAGCDASVGNYRLSVSATRPLTPKPPTCTFRLLTIPPATGYEEVAQLSGAGLVESTPEGFKHDVRAEVCRAGGDVVIPRINNEGVYIGGTILQAVAVAAPAPPAPIPPADH